MKQFTWPAWWPYLCNLSGVLDRAVELRVTVVYVSEKDFYRSSVGEVTIRNRNLLKRNRHKLHYLSSVTVESRFQKEVDV